MNNIILINGSLNFTDERITELEGWYDAKYLFDTTHKGNDELPISIFYAKKKHPEGSNFFGLGFVGSILYISNGYEMATTPMSAVRIDEDGDIVLLHSRTRHDYTEYDGHIIDGGRAYTRTNSVDIVQFKSDEKGNICLV